MTNYPKEKYLCVDLEFTGLSLARDRVISLAAIELENDQPTGRDLSIIVNPERSIPARTTKIHRITDEMVADKPVFAEVALEVREFIGELPVVIHCGIQKNEDGLEFVADRDFLNKEFEMAGQAPVPPEQFCNQNPWSKSLYSQKKFDNVLDEHRIDRKERKREGHSAKLDASLLSRVYPHLRDQWIAYQGVKDRQEANNSGHFPFQDLTLK